MGLAGIKLGVKIYWTSGGIFFSLSHYAEKVLQSLKIYSYRFAKSLIGPSLKLLKNTSESIWQLEYARITGSLMYIMNCTILDMVFTVNVLSSCTSNPK